MRKAMVLLENTKERKEGIRPSELVVCNPHGTYKESMHERIVTLEASLTALARADNGYTFIIGTLDKARQNCINQLGGFGAGDAAMAAYLDAARMSVAYLAHMNHSEIVELIRMSPGSDECMFSMGSRQLTGHAEAQFRAALAQARKSIDLRNYTYSVDVPSGGGTKTYELDLEAFSRVLRHPEMALSCHFSISEPRSIDPGSSGFVADVIKSMQNREIDFYRLLPHSFRLASDGLAEVDSPFETDLASSGIRKRASGTLVKIKLRADEARELLPFVHDDKASGRNGTRKEFSETRKGFSEVYSGNFGMRGFNTFMGKARANSIFTPITWAMHDISTHEVNGKPVMVLPLSGGYLEYWVDLPPTETTRELITHRINTRIHSTNTDPAYANLASFRPVISMLDATKVDIRDAKARFILDSLGTEAKGHPSAVLARMDFLLNFMENVHKRVQEDIYSRLGERRNGGIPLSDIDWDNIAMIRHICSQYRTVRNPEDLVWIIRAGEGLPSRVKEVRDKLEGWLFTFARERVESIQHLLAEKIAMEHSHALGAKPVPSAT
jgi:hypothetical protein